MSVPRQPASERAEAGAEKKSREYAEVAEACARVHVTREAHEPHLEAVSLEQIRRLAAVIAEHIWDGVSDKLDHFDLDTNVTHAQLGTILRGLVRAVGLEISEVLAGYEPPPVFTPPPGNVPLAPMTDFGPGSKAWDGGTPAIRAMRSQAFQTGKREGLEEGARLAREQWSKARPDSGPRSIARMGADDIVISLPRSARDFLPPSVDAPAGSFAILGEVSRPGQQFTVEMRRPENGGPLVLLLTPLPWP